MANILVADDENKIRNVLFNLFEEHKVTMVSNWKEELEELESDKKFDLVITDIVMPGYKEIAGLGIVNIVKKYQTPVIFISGYEEKALTDLPPTMKFIKKPFSIRLMKSYAERMMNLES